MGHALQDDLLQNGQRGWDKLHNLSTPQVSEGAAEGAPAHASDTRLGQSPVHLVDDQLALCALVQRLHACRVVGTRGVNPSRRTTRPERYALDISIGGGVKWLTSTLRQSTRQVGQADTWASPWVSDCIRASCHEYGLLTRHTVKLHSASTISVLSTQKLVPYT